MVLGVVAGLKNGELVMAGAVGEDCRDKILLVSDECRQRDCRSAVEATLPVR